MKNNAVKFLTLGLTAAIMISALLVATGCSSGTKTTASTTSATSSTSTGVSYSKDVQPVFNSHCVVCHAGAGQAGLTLEPNVSYGKLVGVASTENATEMRVKAGAPDQSYLIAKLNGTQVQAGGSGAQMPYGAAPLSQAQISLISQWITAGALNN